MGFDQQITVQWNIPRFTVATPGKQNRACTGIMRITPGLTEVFEFQYCNSDGVSINLGGFTLRLVFWFSQPDYESLAANLADNIVLAKDLTIDKPYEGTATLLLTDQETIRLQPWPSLRWSIYMINEEGYVFPTQITSTGERFGIVYLDRSDIPNAETIKGISISNEY